VRGRSDDDASAGAWLELAVEADPEAVEAVSEIIGRVATGGTTVEPAFELVDSRFRDLKSAMARTPYEFYADHIANGAMVFGAFREDWQKFDFTKTRVSMRQGAKSIIEKTGGHPTGNPAKPAAVLANLRRGSTGLKAGHFIVTGSFTGFHSVALNEPVTGEFEGFGTMEATIVA